jgi:hypothetical protein
MNTCLINKEKNQGFKSAGLRLPLSQILEHPLLGEKEWQVRHAPCVARVGMRGNRRKALRDAPTYVNWIINSYKKLPSTVEDWVNH